jgi:hydroxyacylglutathione hydrolase
MANLYFRQLLAGRDFAKKDRAATQMMNFAYLIGDRDKGECFIVDPAWDVDGLVTIAESDGLKVSGALITHYHPDHCGGSMFGFSVQGAARLLELCSAKLHVHKAEAEGVMIVTEVSKSDLVLHEGNDVVHIGDIEVELLHTPGHTPGSQCFRLKDALISGDTLFLQGCGRVDLPGGDREEMRRTLTQRLATLPDELVLYPGHAYGGEHAPLKDVRATNPSLR